MANFNRVIIIGNLTRDPDYKQLTSGQAVCRLGLASNRQFKNRQTGSMVQEVCYVDIDVWGAQAETCRQYLQKGRAVLVEGRLKFDSWEDPQGKMRSKHSIVADRVLFLPATNSAEFAAAERVGENSAGIAKEDPLEKELLEQIEQIKNRTQAQKEEAAKKDITEKQESQQAGEASPEKHEQVEFKDEPPFEDELPF
ncbi:single-stranded DNA-binding protein [Candidatus Dependentiae bacterium]|nr:MAG: single-stranded DNA-binding protein [Candidatus Dependentiae bacterium]